MTTDRKAVDASTSNAGDDFHQLWAVRRCLELLRPETTLTAVKPEGITPQDAQKIDPTGHAFLSVDLTEYFQGSNFLMSSKVRYSQLKYSTTDPSAPWTCAAVTAGKKPNSSAGSLLRRLADTFKKHLEAVGRETVVAKLELQLVSNRPTHESLLSALAAAQSKLKTKGPCTTKWLLDQLDRTQRETIEKLFKASGLHSRQFTDFLRIKPPGEGWNNQKNMGQYIWDVINPNQRRWPYDARPQSAGEVSYGWRFAEFGQADGLIEFEATAVPPWMQPDSVAYAIEENGSGPVGNAMTEPEPIPMRLEEIAHDRIRFVPLQELDDEAVDRFLLGSVDWKLLSRDPTAWPSHYADNLQRKEWLPAELFLVIDPLVSLSTAIASRSWVWSLTSAAIILIVCLLIPRGFCGYLCPLGTLIDLFDWLIGRRVTRFRVAEEGWWVHIKYYLLAGTLLAAVFGVLISGYVAAIPVITRGMLVVGGPLQNGATRGWHLVPPMHLGHLVSVVMFFAVLSLGLLRPRFWCKYVCPSGATFSLGNLFRLTERKVESSCIHCNKCVEICPFDAIKPDFTTRGTDCTLCQTCAGVCPTHAIKFVERGNLVQLKIADDPPTGETSLGRRGFLSLAGGTAAAVAGGAGITAATRALGAGLEDPERVRPVRPPGSVPERAFLEMCIRCGECFKACPNDVLQIQGFAQGLEGLWTPVVKADWAGCESSCNACGQVCPTGAIRALPLAEKRVARMGLAIVNESTCLPHAGREACDLCVQECDAAGYHAIEYTQVGTATDEAGDPIAGSGYLAPVVRDDKCVGCGLCQTRCYAINVKDKHLLAASAIIVEAGEGKEDRLMQGSYIKLRQQEARQRANGEQKQTAEAQYFVPSSSPEDDPSVGAADDPFGIAPAAPDEAYQDADADPFGLGGF